MNSVDGGDGDTLAAPEASGEPRAARPLVVVVDDEEAIGTLVARVLSAYEVRVFDRPQQALRVLRDGLRPDVIVSDVQMPGMSGFALHAEVRRMAPLRGVPFVYLTALDDRGSLRHGMGLGADDYLTKPFTPDELRQAVAVRLERRAVLTAAPSPLLELTTLGGVALLANGTRLSWEARKVVELLAYLLDHGNEAGVDQVRRALWGSRIADNHLHVLVSRLRKTLAGHGRVGVANDQVWLELEHVIRWDVERFERACAAAEAEGAGALEVEVALASYGGSFLADYDGPWVEARRAGLEGRFVALLELAIACAETDADRRRAEARLSTYLNDA